MINKTINFLLCVGLFGFLLANSVAAKVSTTLGYKYWDSTYEFTIVDGTDSPPTVKSHSGSSAGPTFNIRIKRVFAGINYYRGTYEFFNPSNGNSLEIIRTDTEIYAGYDFVQNFSIIGGIKQFNANLTLTTPLGVQIKSDNDYLGTFVAINGRSNVLGGFVFFFTASLTYLSYSESTAEDASRDLFGPSLEFGTAFVTARNHLLLTLSFKSQSYEADAGVIDNIYGFSGSISYRF